MLFVAGYVEPPRADNKQIEAQARHCNDKKDNAKKAGDLSVEVFFVAALKVRGIYSQYLELLSRIF